MPRPGIFVSLEENSTGETEVEKERTFYAVYPSDLVKAATRYEDQEQWQCQLPDSNDGCRARIRVRKTIKPDGSMELTQTIKVDLPGSIPGHTQVEETQLTITPDVFDQIKRVAKEGMIKRRVFVTSKDGHELQIDAFYASKGEYFPRVKIDYEYTNTMPSTPILPDEFSDVVAGDTTDAADKARIKDWYSTFFTVKNDR
jgi:hypothetical protein